MKKYIAFFEVILYNNSIQLWPTLLWKCLYLQKWKFLLQASSTPPTSSTSSPTYTTPSTGYPSVQGDQRNIGNIGNIIDCHHSKNGKFQFYYTGCPLPKICECGLWSTDRYPLSPSRHQSGVPKCDLEMTWLNFLRWGVVSPCRVLKFVPQTNP